jgi:hypothetical protein
MEKQRRNRVTAKLPAYIDERVNREVERRDISKIDWILEAVQEKIERIETGADAVGAPLAGLSDDDRCRAKRYIQLLAESPDDKKFRRAVDANFDWLTESKLRSQS